MSDVHHRRLGRAISELLDQYIAILEYPDLQEPGREPAVGTAPQAERQQHGEDADHQEIGRMERNQKNARVVHNAAA